MVWETKKLGEVCTNLDNKRIPITKKDRVEGAYPYYGASGTVDYVNDYLFDEELLLVSEDGANLLARTYPIAFSVSGKIWVNNHAHVLKFNELNNQRYVEYYLNSIKLNDYVSGMAQPKLNQKSLNSIELPYPKLEEQKQIVAILDQAFEKIEQARATAEKNLQNARELFESYLNSFFNELTEGWQSKNLNDVVELNCSLSYGIVQPGKDYDDGLPIVRPTDLSIKRIPLTGLKQIDPELARSYNRTTLVGGDLLLCVRGSTGVIGVASEDLKGANVTRGIVPIRFEPSIINQEFGYYLLRSSYVQKQIKEKTYGAALMQINIRDLKKISVVFPKIETQNNLIKIIHVMDSDTKQLETIYQQKLNCLEELKKSILQKAFNGELTQGKVS